MKTIHLNMFGWNIYIADHALKSRSGQKRNKAERRLKQVETARLMAEKGVCACELCGKEGQLQMHHLWAVAEFPEKALEQNNTMLVCPACHQRIHNNPFLWCRLINERKPQPKNELLQFNF